VMSRNLTGTLPSGLLPFSRQRPTRLGHFPYHGVGSVCLAGGLPGVVAARAAPRDHRAIHS